MMYKIKDAHTYKQEDFLNSAKKIKDLEAWAILPDGKRDWYGISMFGSISCGKYVEVNIPLDTLKKLVADVEALTRKDNDDDR